MRDGKKIIVWFRNDLRLHDHQPLVEAIQKSTTVIPFFCFDSRYFTGTKYGTGKTGAFRAKFLIESVAALRTSLQELGGDLVIRTGVTEDQLVELASSSGATSVYAYKEVASEEVKISDLAEEKLWKIKVSMYLYLGNTLYNKEDLPIPIRDIPDVFTNFKKKVERDAFVRKCFDVPDGIHVDKDIDVGALPCIEELGMHPVVDDERAAIRFVGGEKEGLHRLSEFIWEKELIKTYKDTRNQMLGPDYSSKLSPWLSLGCISPRKVYEQVKAFEKDRVANGSTQWLLYELMWRDYFRFILKKHGNKIFAEEGLKLEKPGRDLENETSNYEKWKTGQTGIPFIDANMAELSHTGFMSNRGRQNVASFLVHDLKVLWLLGAAYFEQQLIDYNPASNWGNWAYIAGVGNDPRENRCFNILKQAHDYDPQGAYVKHWLPVLERIPAYLVHQPYLMTKEQQTLYGVTLGNDYPLPILAYKKFEKQY